MNVVGAGRIGQLDLPEGSRQHKPDLATLVLLVAAHGVKQPIGVESGERDRQTEPLEQVTQSQGDLGADPAQALGQLTFGDHAGRHGLTMLKGPVIAGDRLDRMADGVAEVEHGSRARFLALVLRHDLGFEPAASRDDRPQGLAAAVEYRLGPGFQLAQEGGIQNDPVLDHLGEAAAELAQVTSSGFRCQSRPRQAGETRR